MSTAKSEGVIEMVHPKSGHLVRVPYGPRIRDGVGRIETLARFREKGYMLPEDVAAKKKLDADAAELADLRKSKRKE